MGGSLGEVAYCVLEWVNLVIDLGVGGKQQLSSAASHKNRKLVSHQMFAYLVAILCPT